MNIEIGNVKRVLLAGLLIVLALFVLSIMSSENAEAADIYVDVSNAGDPAMDGSITNPYDQIQKGIDSAASGVDKIHVATGVYNENVIVDRAIEIVDSAVDIRGDLSIVPGGSLLIDPTWINVTGNITVDSGSELVLIDTIMQINSTYNGEFGIQVNNSAYFNVTQNSIIRQGLGFYYFIDVYGRLEVTDSSIQDPEQVYLDNADPTSILDNASISDWDTYGLFLNNTSVYMYNTSLFSGGTGFDVGVDNDSHLVSINSTFNKGSIEFSDGLSNITVKWFLHVYVENNVGAPIAGAQVNAVDAQGTQYLLGTTDGTGWLRWALMTEGVGSAADVQMFTPHYIYVEQGPLYGCDVVNMNVSQATTIRVVLTKVHNVEKALDYPGIQLAANDADWGNHLEVYAGYHNETGIMLNKSLTVTGVGAATCIVDGKGFDHTFILESDSGTDELTGMNITSDRNGNMACVYSPGGGYYIHQNRFWGAIGLYVSALAESPPSFTMGDSIIELNFFECLIGVFFDDMYVQNATTGTNIQIGDIIIENNTFICSGTFGVGVSIDMIGMNNVTGSQFTFGDIAIIENTMTLSATGTAAGVFFDGEIINIQDSVVQFGDIDISNNTITTTAGSGGIIICEFYEVRDIRGASSITFGNVYINDNIGNSVDAGIGLSPDDFGRDLYDTASISTGDFYLVDNEVTAVNSGVFVSFDGVGYDMYNDTSMSMGNMSIQENNATVTNNFALYLNYEYMAYEMYHNSYFSMGWTDVSDNNVSSTNDFGMYVNMEYLGSYMYGSSQAYFGSSPAFIFTNNDIWAPNNLGFLFNNFRYLGYYNEDNTYVSFGDLLPTFNSI